jgi:sarcosine oxidase subunit alpha
MINRQSDVHQDLRIASVQRGKRITLLVDGRPVKAYEGETVHAALTAEGIRDFRVSKAGSPRGIFCGMGICYECLVTIDNLPDQRACMTIVRDRMEILTVPAPVQKQELPVNNRGEGR